jgi:hypothetical protein
MCPIRNLQTVNSPLRITEVLGESPGQAGQMRS